MQVKQKYTGRVMSVPGGLAVGVGISLLVTAVGAAVLAWLLDGEKLLWENVGYGIMGMLLCASFFGSLAAFRRIRRQRMLVCMLSGVAYLGVMLSMTALFFGGQYEGVGVTALLVLGGSGAAGMLGLKPEKGRGGKAKVRIKT